MDFSSLPDTAFLRIVDYFPWYEQIRLGQVSKSFQRISQLATSSTKLINLTDYRFEKFSSDRLRALLDLCSLNLERIKLPVWRPQWASILADYECPRLVEVDIDYCDIENAIFGQLVQNNRTIKSLFWRTYRKIARFIEYPDVVLEDLNTLRLGYCNDDTLRSMTGRFPNLVSLHLYTKDISSKVLDQFLASIPRVQQIKLYLTDNQFGLEDLVNLWNCPLTSLDIVYSAKTIPFVQLSFMANDAFLHKIATRLPKLNSLELSRAQVSNMGISFLGNLKELEFLDLRLPPGNFDDGMRGLAQCGRLQKLFMPCSKCSTYSLVNLLRSCPSLRVVDISHVRDVESPEMAVVFLESLSGMPTRHVRIGFRYSIQYAFWEAEPVKQMMMYLNESEGLIIEIEMEYDHLKLRFS